MLKPRRQDVFGDWSGDVGAFAGVFGEDGDDDLGVVGGGEEGDPGVRESVVSSVLGSTGFARDGNLAHTSGIGSTGRTCGDGSFKKVFAVDL